MEITEIRISRRTQGDGKLKGYAAVTFDDVFVVRDLKIIEGKKGLFVAMPSQKIQAPCPKCKKKNALRSKFCNECGQRLPLKEKTRREIHRDIAHPVNSDMRSYLQKVIIEAYQANQGSVDDNSDHFDDSDSYDDSDHGTVESTTDDYLSTTSLKDEERVSKKDVETSSKELLDTIE
ncbi:MAG: hypothetical protein ACD_79C00837G0003 [uncultured bacterium]|nr:MAG: hypothetical protein ACD_79C00837G0003 [uncultured bacterium]